MDTLTREQRSERMSRVRSRDTKPEMAVRRLAHSLGYRYRLHGRKLPGNPDMVFASRKKVLFVHGCFWHRHPTTVRDALTGLPDPRDSSRAFANHEYRAGAKPYLGHTGNPLDEPSKALKAGEHGVPCGEDMMMFRMHCRDRSTMRNAA